MDFFEKYADRYDIDLTGATTREEKIEIFAKERKYVFSFIFENLTKEEKIKYLEYAHAKDIEEFLLTLLLFYDLDSIWYLIYSDCF